MHRLSHAVKLSRRSIVCTHCGRSRPPKRYAQGSTVCTYCTAGRITRRADERRQLAHARTKALAGMPYQVTCAKCKQDRPATYYPWIPDTAAKGATCNACLRRPDSAKGGRPRVIREYRPQGAELATQHAVQRAQDREQAELSTKAQARVLARQCADCWHVKPPDQFTPEPARRDGLSLSCTACQNAYRVLHPAGQWRTARDTLRKLVTGK